MSSFNTQAYPPNLERRTVSLTPSSSVLHRLPLRERTSMRLAAWALATARTAFAPWINKPREASAERSGVTASIPALDRQGKTLLRGQLDPLMNRFRLTNPTLYAGYRAARVIVDRHGAGGTPTPPPPTPPPPGP